MGMIKFDPVQKPMSREGSPDVKAVQGQFVHKLAHLKLQKSQKVIFLRRLCWWVITFL